MNIISRLRWQKNAFIEVETYAHDIKSLKALICLPPGDGPFPVVMAIHGGAFVEKNRKQYHKSFFQHYVKRGIAVVAVEYRLAQEGGHHPHAIRDCLHNLHWLHDHATEYRFDAQRICLQGSSAGSYLAMMVALTCDRPDFQPDFGPYQHCTSTVNAVVSCAAMYGWTAIKQGDRYIGSFRDEPSASPINLASYGPCENFLLIGGAQDAQWSPPDAARQMKAQLEAAGKHCELHLKENHSHPALYDDQTPFSRWAFSIIDAFWDSTLI